MNRCLTLRRMPRLGRGWRREGSCSASRGRQLRRDGDTARSALKIVRSVLYMKGGGRFVTSESLGDIEARLDPEIFYRCHKSYIINLHEIDSITPYGRWTYVVRICGTQQTRSSRTNAMKSWNACFREYNPPEATLPADYCIWGGACPTKFCEIGDGSDGFSPCAQKRKLLY